MSAKKDHFIYCPPLEPLQVLYEDEHYLAIDKPAGLLSVPGRLPEHQDSAFLRVLEISKMAKVTHRLDMATSGILMFAKHRAAEVEMSKIFQKRAVKKIYIALVQGKIDALGEVDVPLITDWPNRPKQKVDLIEGKSAKTCYQCLDYNEQKDRSRVLLKPVTGRSHQLRVHMMHIGHPILGDQFYHPRSTEFEQNRMALHAHMLSFQHPLIGGENIEIVSNVPF
ncbi:pseudouridine synthase [Acinetobacter nectaris]|uniref:Pseudouridine synthase RsuA/RluA-like domain-containing protein n=1 Tax=Acinetobacter nectaris CIP 110549 TaxID=1392540 RepID=V2TQ05_9GAMM|nr:pseudouridine synthase [Acinetobacter nectaris]ESK40126.1 hypothetical protein P256_00566 [Acinetobacter nectaris CIP 110549]MCF9034060.1 RNA pseudouridine synthase [Acinetobacter nectaris]